MDTPAPPAVIPAAKRIYTEAAATLALDGATHVYVQRGGVGLPLADNYAGPYLVLKKRPKVFKLAGQDQGGRRHQGPAEAPCGASTAGGGGSATQGAATQEETRSSSRLQKICG